MSQPIDISDLDLVRNYEILSPLMQDIQGISLEYGLKRSHVDLLLTLVNAINSYNAYIEIPRDKLTMSRKTLYRSLDKLENENIITVAHRSQNQHDVTQVFFTIAFIKKLCGEDYSKKYRIWHKWQLQFKKIKKNRQSHLH